MKKYLIIAFTVTLALMIASTVFLGCADYEGEVEDNFQPEIVVIPGQDSIVVSSSPILSWRGFDRDGEVYRFEYIDIVKSKMDESTYNSYYENPQSVPDDVVNGLEGEEFTWHSTDKNSDTLFISLEQGEDTTEHLICVRGIDPDSAYSENYCAIWYRTNRKPDSLYITTERFADDDFDTLWCLKAAANRWDGIDVSWYGHDPDGSIILEYKWAVINLDNLTDTVASSYTLDRGDYEDGEWTGGPESGDNIHDGWLRGRKEAKLTDIPTGNYKFKVHIRDDAFYEGDPDSFLVRLIKPSFDPTDTGIVESIHNGTYEHKVLIVDATLDAPFLLSQTPEDESFSHNFYQSIFDELGYENVLFDIEDISAANAYPDWEFSKDTLAKYSVLYWLDAEARTNQKITPVETDGVIQGLKDYISVGGNVIIDGRKTLLQELGAVGDTSLATSYFGILGYNDGSFDYADGVVTSRYDYPDLEPNTDLGDEEGIDISDGILAIQQVPPSYAGLPFAEPIYFFKDTEGSSSTTHNKPVALRYTTSTFKTAYFSFPLYLMDNSEGQVTEALDITIDYITDRHLLLPEEDDTTGQNFSIF